ncbi:M20/M25/M40 family metallo-hydrolase [Candidatus Peregrinibacteria bacterium]|nr:M20/M25/M40 family metallo-hydrolase [Candidatus Peregrinibacteria bacterium]
MSELRLETVFNTLADCGWDKENRRNCLAFSAEEDKAHEEFKGFVDQLKTLADEKGLNVFFESDVFGNSYAILEGDNDEEIVVCSHLDSVINGGRFDGVVGVATGLNLIQRYIKEGLKPKYNIRVAAFRAEESSITGYSCLGSSLATGVADESKLRKKKLNGHYLSLHDFLRVKSGHEEVIQNGPFLNGNKIRAVFEVHTEQSAVLERLDRGVGVVVKGIGGSRRSDLNILDNRAVKNSIGEAGRMLKRLRITSHGTAGHTGGLPMNGEIILGEELKLRKDAVIKMMELLSALDPGGFLVSLNVPEGAYNTVPEKCVAEFLVHDDFDMNTHKLYLGSLFSGHKDIEMEIISNDEVEEITYISDNVRNAAVELIIAVDDIAGSLAMATNGEVRATVSKISSANGVLTLGIDERRLDEETGNDLTKIIEETREELAKKYDVLFEEENVVDTKSTPLSDDLSAIIRSTYVNLFEEEPVEIGSMPSHDAAKVIRCNGEENLIPGAMIFVRSLNGGISHHPAELCDIDDMTQASILLYETIKKV